MCTIVHFDFAFYDKHDLSNFSWLEYMKFLKMRKREKGLFTLISITYNSYIKIWREIQNQMNDEQKVDHIVLMIFNFIIA